MMNGMLRILPALGLAALAIPAAFPPAPSTAAPARTGWTRPAALAVGDTIAFVAPAGPADPDKVGKAKERFETMGFKVQVPPTLTQRKDRYLAGSDADRAAEFNAAVTDRSVKAIFAVKGGYGLTRILDRIDYAAIAENPKIICGFSDLTALHLAIARKCRLVTFHAPMPQYGLYRNEPGFNYSNDLFWRTIRADGFAKGGKGYTLPLADDGPKPKALVRGQARGRIVGGNLSLIAATMGTPYAIEAEGNILLLEDTGEKGYRVDRMLAQMKLAGVLDKFAGAVIGTFDGTDDEELAILLREYFGKQKYPVIINFPVGHTAFNATFPHGGLAAIDADAGTVQIVEPAVVK